MKTPTLKGILKKNPDKLKNFLACETVSYEEIQKQSQIELDLIKQMIKLRGIMKSQEIELKVSSPKICMQQQCNNEISIKSKYRICSTCYPMCKKCKQNKIESLDYDTCQNCQANSKENKKIQMKMLKQCRQCSVGFIPASFGQKMCADCKNKAFQNSEQSKDNQLSSKGTSQLQEIHIQSPDQQNESEETEIEYTCFSFKGVNLETSSQQNINQSYEDNNNDDVLQGNLDQELLQTQKMQEIIKRYQENILSSAQLYIQCTISQNNFQQEIENNNTKLQTNNNIEDNEQKLQFSKDLFIDFYNKNTPISSLNQNTTKISLNSTKQQILQQQTKEQVKATILYEILSKAYYTLAEKSFSMMKLKLCEIIKKF